MVNDQLLHPGRSVNLNLEGKSFGKFGQIHPLIAEENQLPQITYLFELDLNQLLNASTRKNIWTVTYKDYPTVPCMELDISIIVSRNTNSADVVRVIQKAGKPLLENVELIDRFEGKELEEDHCSQTYRLRYRGKHTLKDDDIKPIHNKVREILIKQFNANLRS